MLAPIDSPQMADFVARIEDVNTAAEAATGFVWRMTGNVSWAVSRRLFGEERLLVNLSVWESAQDLSAFVFRDDQHAPALRARRSWFAATAEPMTVCWWVPAGTVPTLREAAAKLQQLRSLGPSQDAFPLAEADAWPPGMQQ